MDIHMNLKFQHGLGQPKWPLEAELTTEIKLQTAAVELKNLDFLLQVPGNQLYLSISEFKELQR